MDAKDSYDEQTEYNVLYHTITNRVSDFQFDPIHVDELSTATVNDVCVFKLNNQERKIQYELPIDTRLKRSSEATYNNIMCYNTKNYVIATYNASDCLMTLADPDT